MEKITRSYAAGYLLLGLILLVGALLIWNARSTLELQVAQEEEAAQPAEIELTLIAPSTCEACTDGNILLDEIQKLDIRVLESETFLSDSDEGIALIQAYNITRVPTILVRGEYDKENVRSAFESLGGDVQDETLVIEISQPVYLDLARNEVVGLVHVTYLTDSSCTDCYDPTKHKPILENNFGVTIQSEQSIDAGSSEGQALIAQYAITQTPTVLLSSQALAYSKLSESWAQVGTIEEDGTFVFRKNSALGAVIYNDLETGELIRPETAEE
ncbi:hypothetical protein CO174_01805 [Candidatus Uhrbacteria bacterium CG_4_9_14_3_um_filter_50_9]|uniref:Thioredoxin-like fold domain-containing protein n=1 Tax=Candidatus Uhrbacteria bacterium CG_4_9_14_3_um_filter_50_9 TaxID=1975035 RepID=A0A2M7XCU8_9BACT|nr:MAG: hypothetical protein CO174_01805 [Candidatus Uhrbacteria bacterium CG_4_9_14_3_um_filter_50_9]